MSTGLPWLPGCLVEGVVEAGWGSVATVPGKSRLTFFPAAIVVEDNVGLDGLSFHTPVTMTTANVAT